MATKMPIPRKLTKFIKCSSRSIVKVYTGEHGGTVGGRTGAEEESDETRGLLTEWAIAAGMRARI